MTRGATDRIALPRALALLAAVFAISLSIFLPTAAAASSGSDTPIRLCSGAMSNLVIADGQVREKTDGEMAINPCAFVMAGHVALPSPPPAPLAPRVRPTDSVVRIEARTSERPPARAPPRPPSTAPPYA